MITDFKLSNIVLKVDGHATAHPELYYRAPAGSASYDEGARALRMSARTDFLTYVNACSACKWRQYAGIDLVRLRIVASGRGRIVTTGVFTGAAEPTIIEEYVLSSHAPTVLDVDVPTPGLDLVGFTVIPHAGMTLDIHRSYWYAQVDERDVNPVGLAVATTTFRKEDYIVPNIALVKAGVEQEGGPLADRFHMFVVDNGRTLDAAALSDDTVTVIPNPNVGGAGGFARGMIAALDAGDRFTHVLLMDDDVRVMPESLIRTFNLLSLAKGRYRDAFVNGAMLSLEEPCRQFEDVARITRSGLWPKVKPDLDVSRLPDLLVNERTSVEVENAYGAWWFSCIPLKAVRANGLPMPFFVRGDDMEFGVRNQPVYMVMSGICVWHASFEGRFKASVDCYQQVRNFLAMIAVDDAADERVFMMRVKRMIRRFLRDLGYGAAEQLLDGIEDYLRGPEFLATADGAALMREHAAANEVAVPVADIDPALLAAAGVTERVLADSGRRVEPSSRLLKLWRAVPYDKNYLPGPLLGHKVSYVVDYGSATIEGDSYRAETLVVLDPTRKTAVVRKVDRKRFRSIRLRYHRVMGRWRRDGGRVRREWRKARANLTSRTFWEAYLRLDGDGGAGKASGADGTGKASGADGAGSAR